MVVIAVVISKSIQEKETWNTRLELLSLFIHSFLVVHYFATTFLIILKISIICEERKKERRNILLYTHRRRKPFLNK